MFKMKYKMIALVLALLFVFTGCSGVQAEYWNKMKQAYKWEGVETKQTGQVIMQVGLEQIKVDFKTMGYMNQKEMSGHFNIEMKMEMPENFMPAVQTEAVGTAVVKPEPLAMNMEIYMDKGKVYMSKAYFEQAFALSGEPVPEAFKKLDAKYIGLKESNELTAVMLEMMGNKESIDTFIKAYEELGKLLGVDIPVIKEGNTYKVTLGKQELIALVKSIMNNGVANIEKINEQFQLGFVQEDIVELKEEYTTQKAMIENQIDQVAALVDGNLSYTTTFEKGKQIDTMALKIGPSPEFAPFIVEVPEMNMSLNQTSTKVAPKTIKVPGKVVELSQQELNELMGMSEMMDMEEVDTKMSVPNNK